MHIKQIVTLLILGLSLFPVQQVMAVDEKSAALMPMPAASKPKEIVVVGTKAYEVGPQGQRTPLADGEYSTAAYGMIIIVGGSAIVSPRDAASGMPTGKRQHKPMVLMEMNNAGLNPQPLPPKSMEGGFAKPSNPLTQQALNPQPLPPKSLSASSLNPAAANMLNPQPLPPKKLVQIESLPMQKKADQQMNASEAASSAAKKPSDTTSGIMQNLK